MKVKIDEEWNGDTDVVLDKWKRYFTGLYNRPEHLSATFDHAFYDAKDEQRSRCAGRRNEPA